MKIEHGDRLKVRTYPYTATDIWIEIADATDLLGLTAAQARKLARKLIAAADAIDPRPVVGAYDAATLAPIIAKDEPYVPQVGDVVDVRKGAAYLPFAGKAARARVISVDSFGNVEVEGPGDAGPFSRWQVTKAADLTLASRP